MRRPLVAAALAAALAVALPSCTAGVRRSAPSPTPTAVVDDPTADDPAATATPVTCPEEYAAPDPKRPRVRLTFDLSENGRTVTGTERVEFTPDEPVSELVFRAWPNSPGSTRDGGRLEVTKASLPMTVEAAGAGPGAPGTLVRLALPAPVAAGTTVTADLSFTLTLPKADIDRYGFDDTMSWWGSGHPLLAWQRGRGWALDPAVAILGETAVSETASYDVTVTAPAAYTVVGSGLTGAPADADGGRRRWRFTNDTARDVAVVAIRQPRIETFASSGVPVLVAMDPRLSASETLGPIRANVDASMREFRRRFGPFPYESLTVAAMRPIASAGVEYPGIVFVGTRRYDLVVTHEVAHEWFYGLVGNNQATEPWLDESFATYAESLVNGADEDYEDYLEQREAVGQPMSYWNENRRQFGPIVYSKGAAALLLAREGASPRRFDAAIRCYVNRNAHRIATAADVSAALAAVPEARIVLRGVGALR